MRKIAAIALALVATGCWTPGPGQLDPTRYPWDQPFCVVSLQTPAATGIVSPEAPSSTMIVARGQVPSFEQAAPGARVTQLACNPGPPGRRSRRPTGQ